MHNLSKRFTVAVIHRNGVEQLKKVLNSILDAVSENDQIIVVDNNSSDNSVHQIEQDAKYTTVKFIKHTCNAGYGYSCNQAMRSGSSQYFLLCNNDIELTPDCLNQFETLFASEANAGLIGPQMYSPTGKKMRSYSAQTPNMLSQLDLIGRPIKNQVIHSFSPVSILRGACLAVRKDMVDEVGMYDEDFRFYHEETEWCIRINRSNKWQVMFAPEVEIVHVGGGGTSNLFASSRIEFFRSRLIFWEKVYSKQQVIILYLWNIPKLLLDFLFYLVATLATLGRSVKLKNKLIDRTVVITWLLIGKPKNWGLPDRCTK